jgi:CHAD domain-containing protein
MKPQPIDLRGTADEHAVAQRIIQTRLDEVRRLASGLEGRGKQELHDFRIACKRLRYALERFEALAPGLAPRAERLALLQDALGEAHDRDVLLAILPPSMARTERRLHGERESYVDRALTLWKRLSSDLNEALIRMITDRGSDGGN